jgi:hypothetical protein
MIFLGGQLGEALEDTRKGREERELLPADESYSTTPMSSPAVPGLTPPISPAASSRGGGPGDSPPQRSYGGSDQRPLARSPRICCISRRRFHRSAVIFANSAEPGVVTRSRGAGRAVR